MRSCSLTAGGLTHLALLGQQVIQVALGHDHERMAELELNPRYADIPSP